MLEKFQSQVAYLQDINFSWKFKWERFFEAAAAIIAYKRWAVAAAD